MSIRPDELVERAGEGRILADAVETHLDAYPLPVDDDEAARHAARLQTRIEAKTRPQARPVPWLAAVGLLAAAVLLATLTTVATRSGTATTIEVDDAAAVLRTEDGVRVVTVPFTTHVAGRDLVSDPGSTLMSSEQGQEGVVLVQDGRASLDGVEVPASHWAIVPNSDAKVVVFPDGEAPPQPVSDTVEAQLDDLRFRSLPPRTLDALDALHSP